jgi:hypothetical protein
VESILYRDWVMIICGFHVDFMEFGGTLEVLLVHKESTATHGSV